MLTIDCGNSNIKWALYAGESKPPEVLKSGAFRNAQINDELPVLVAKMLEGATHFGTASALKIVIANVAGGHVAAALKCAFSTRAATLHFAASQASACGVRNGYAQPHTLGADRFAALIAAHQQQQNQLVVMAGTALTIDALNADGDFLGGLIVPGLYTMQQSLYRGTAQLPEVLRHDALVCALPTSTDAAIASGAVQACVGAVALQALTFAGVLAAQNQKLQRIVLAGGASQTLLAPLKTAIEAVFSAQTASRLPATILQPNLVLDGLYCLGLELAAQ